jgi:glucosamine--fructose-6-phosphate aminotransferase (isomerizing)
MCGIFGFIASGSVNRNELETLAKHAEQRGKDSSGLCYWSEDSYHIKRADLRITELLKNTSLDGIKFLMGHSRLITNGLSDNQPVIRDSSIVIHNGIIVNDASIWSELDVTRRFEIDTEIIAAIADTFVSNEEDLIEFPSRVITACEGVVACAVVFPNLGKLSLFSNNGSLYVGINNNGFYFSSEKFPLEQIECDSIEQVREIPKIIDIPVNSNSIRIDEIKGDVNKFIVPLGSNIREENILEYKRYELKRCTRCILPHTMPFITFDGNGVCNYCNNYTPRNKPKSLDELFKLVEPYRKTNNKNDCIVPFSGGRDSCYALHLIIKELNLKPVTYTYDWGMVTDLGRRNISRMCSKLKVENIIIADDIGLKRRNIANNLRAWLSNPSLGMVSILTAGDKHFFRHIETVKHQTGITLNLWGVNPLEQTHFKSGFLGVPPDFDEKMVYSSKLTKQVRYQWLRFREMMRSPGYFNSSLMDTLTGEYYRSFFRKSDYFHIFDYYKWDEQTIDNTLIGVYDWEKAPDTNTTWRIGDGTAAIYNYIYYTIAGFTEHDTFRSNQIREGDITRERALSLVEDENRPRYPNIKWYLDAIGLDYESTIRRINATPKLL